LKKEALICGPVSYHDYAGILVDENMRKQIAKGFYNLNFYLLILISIPFYSKNIFK